MSDKATVSSIMSQQQGFGLDMICPACGSLNVRYLGIISYHKGFHWRNRFNLLCNDCDQESYFEIVEISNSANFRMVVE